MKDKEEKKWRSKFLYLHGIVHFVLILIITMSIDYWLEALMITLIHIIIDAVKLQFQKDANKRYWFFIDQALHLLTLFFVWTQAVHFSFYLILFQDVRLWGGGTAILFLLRPTSFIIKMVISKWSPLNDKNILSTIESKETATSLVNAGQLIGFTERLLVLVFILVGKWEGVGFLMAAKSVFRFGDLKEAKDMKLTEYILIGTFLSFGIAVMVGIISVHILKCD